MRTLGRLFDGLDDRGDRLRGSGLAACAGMHHQEVGTQRHGTDNFIMEGLNRARLQHALRRRQIDQIICVNHQRAEFQFITPRAKRLRIHFGNTRRAALPHPRAGGENLQRVATELARRFQRVQVAPRDGRVNADSNAAIHPRWRLRFRLRFRAVLVFRVEFRGACKRRRGHACCDIFIRHKLSILAHAPNPPRYSSICGTGAACRRLKDYSSR